MVEPRILPGPVAEARRILERQGSKAAVVQLDALSAEHPAIPEPRALAALAALWSGDLADSQRRVAALIESDPGAPAYALAAEVAMFLGDDETRERMLGRATAADPDHFLTLRVASQRLLVLGEYEAGRQALERTLDLYPEDRTALRTLAIVHRLRNDAEAEAAILDNPPDWFRGTPSHHLARHTRALARRDLQAAEEEALAAIAASSGSDAQAWADLSTVRRHLNKPVEAEEAANTALQLNSRQPNALNTLAALAAQRGDNKRSEELRRRAADAVPGIRGQGLVAAANAAQARGDLKAAEAALREAVRQSQGFMGRTARLLLVSFLINRGQWEKARVELDLAISADGLSEGLRCLRMRMMDHDGRKAEALQDLDALVGGPEPLPSAVAPAIGILHANGDQARVEALARYMLDRLPGAAPDLAATVIALDTAGHKQQARELFEAAEKRYPGNSALRIIAVGYAAEGGEFGHVKYEMSRLPPELRRRMMRRATLANPRFWLSLLKRLFVGKRP